MGGTEPGLHPPRILAADDNVTFMKSFATVVGGCAMAVAATVWIGVQGQEDPPAGVFAADAGHEVARDRSWLQGAGHRDDPASVAPRPDHRPRLGRLGRVPARFRDRQVQGRRHRSAVVNSTLSQVSGGRPSSRRGRTSRSYHRHGRRPPGGRGRTGAPRDVEYAQPRLPQPQDVQAERSARTRSVELSGDRHGAGLGHPARLRPAGHRRGARHRRGLQVGDLPLQLVLRPSA